MNTSNYDPVKYAVPGGARLTCKGWVQEAALRMLLNNLKPEASERPDELIMYSEQGLSARSFSELDGIIAALKVLENDETLLIQNGKPLGIIKTHKDAPRVLISNSLVACNLDKWQHFEEFDKIRLMTYGELNAGSWLYIGSQGILLENYETYASIASKYFNCTLEGTLNVTAGLGAMGSAQPLAITMNGGVALVAEVEEYRVDKCISSKYLDVKICDIDRAIDFALEAKETGSAISIGVLGNAVQLLEHLTERNIIPDTITDQTSAHDPLMGYCAHEMSYEYSKVLRLINPSQYLDYAGKSMYRHVQLMMDLQGKGAITFDYGNNLRVGAQERGLKDASGFPGFIPSYARPKSCDGRGPFRWAALSGDKNDIAISDKIILNMFSENKGIVRWMKRLKDGIDFQGLPTRICWLGQDEREKVGLAFNELVRTGKVKAPIVISRDHLDTGAKGYSNRQTDSISNLPILNALVNAAGGASWVSLQCSVGVGVDQSILAGMVIVADGSDDAALRLSRVLRNDQCMVKIRQADVGNKILQKPPEKYKFNLKDRLILNEI